MTRFYFFEAFVRMFPPLLGITQFKKFFTIKIRKHFFIHVSDQPICFSDNDVIPNVSHRESVKQRGLKLLLSLQIIPAILINPDFVYNKGTMAVPGYCLPLNRM